MPPRFPKVSHANCGASHTSSTGLGCVGLKGQTKPLMMWAVCLALGKTFNLSVSQFFRCKMKIIISLSHMIGGRNKEITYVKCLAQCLELSTSGNSIFLN